MEIFKNDNAWNEKAIVGFIAFAVMCMIMIADLVTGWVGKDLIINDYVYNLVADKAILKYKEDIDPDSIEVTDEVVGGEW